MEVLRGNVKGKKKTNKEVGDAIDNYMRWVGVSNEEDAGDSVQLED